ncbi:MAG: arginyl-tRNA synthetase [Candidatus Dependentiae bacterium]|nr:arginyl-tRNA synthetase [Candidatus Dependentiae bacterium]
MFTIRALSDALILLIADAFTLSADEVRASGATVTLLDSSSHHTGDLTTNAAMTLARLLKKPPRVIAEQIVSILSHGSIAKVEIAGPGFINITLTGEAWARLAEQIQANPTGFFKTESTQNPHSYLIEYVSANPTGPLHLGHGRNAIIGDILARVLRFIGHSVATEFYINDAGSQMQKLGMSLKARCIELSGATAEIPEEGYHGEYLIEVAENCLQEHGNDILNNDIAFFTAYAQEQLIAQQKTELADYGIVIDTWFSELSLHRSSAITDALTELEKRGYLYEKDGALWFKSTDFGDDKDRVIRKQDGSLTYIAPDIAYHVNKFSRGAQTLIDIVGQDHHGYVLRLKGTLAALGYDASHLDVILYQLVSLKQGDIPVKMSKRSGNFIGLREVIDTVGVDAARFFFLHKKADSHLELDIDVALKQTQENPIFYLQYAYVRTLSIMNKAAEANITPSIQSGSCTAEEIAVFKKVLGLGHALNAVATQYATHILATYALDLAQTFHTFYTNNKVIDLSQPETSARRLALVRVVQQTLGLTLDLLGLSRRESM